MGAEFRAVTWSGGEAEPGDESLGILGWPPPLVVGGIVNTAGIGIKADLK